MIVQLDNADEICRCIIYARAFQGSIHADEHLWPFGPARDDGVYHESAVLRRFAPDPRDVHDIGCRIAARQNERVGAPPGPKRRYYCGYRSAPYGALPTEGDGYEVKITHSPEHGEEAHVDVALIINVQGKSARAVRRTDAGLALAEHFGPPEPHCCECDLTDDQHPFAKWGKDCLVSGLRDRWPGLYLDDPNLHSESNDNSDPALEF